VRKLPVKGLDPKGEIIDKYLTIVIIAQIFNLAMFISSKSQIPC
jgi:hypothetical protein